MRSSITAVGALPLQLVVVDEADDDRLDDWLDDDEDLDLLRLLRYQFNSTFIHIIITFCFNRTCSSDSSSFNNGGTALFDVTAMVGTIASTVVFNTALFDGCAIVGAIASMVVLTFHFSDSISLDDEIDTIDNFFLSPMFLLYFFQTPISESFLCRIFNFSFFFCK